MDEYIPPILTSTGEPARLFLQIAEYLGERGYSVLRYNKRGIALGGIFGRFDAIVARAR